MLANTHTHIRDTNVTVDVRSSVKILAETVGAGECYGSHNRRKKDNINLEVRFLTAFSIITTLAASQTCYWQLIEKVEANRLIT